MLFLRFFFLFSSSMGTVYNILDYGALPNNKSFATENVRIISDVVELAQPGDTVLVPNTTFHVIGGIQIVYKNSLTFQLDGTLDFVDDIDNWPKYFDYIQDQKWKPSHGVNISHCSNLIFTSSGIGMLQGNGKLWWNKALVGKLTRPKLLEFKFVNHSLIERIHLINAPKYHIYAVFISDTVFQDIDIFVDRAYQRKIKSQARRLSRQPWEALLEQDSSWPSNLQPWDLNTDGIDVRGQNLIIRNVRVTNDDDSIAIKPLQRGTPTETGFRWCPQVYPGYTARDPWFTKCRCSENILVENAVLTGFGASIGSVPAHSFHNCVRNITFRNIFMPDTGKGIYIKSDPTCVLNKTAEISNILYENITIRKPAWWALWIGPQQMNEPGSDLGKRCALTYPLEKHCPTQGCVDFRNITLRNVVIDRPALSPGVVHGNQSNPMQGIVFDNVTVINDKLPLSRVPFGSRTLECVHAHVTQINSGKNGFKFDCST